MEKLVFVLMAEVQNGLGEGTWYSRISSADEGILKVGKNRLLSGKFRFMTRGKNMLRSSASAPPSLSATGRLSSNCSTRRGKERTWQASRRI